MWSSTASWGRRPSGPSTGQIRSCSWSSTGCRPPDTTTSWWTGAPSSRCLSEVGFAGRSHEYPKVKEGRRMHMRPMIRGLAFVGLTAVALVLVAGMAIAQTPEEIEEVVRAITGDLTLGDGVAL